MRMYPGARHPETAARHPNQSTQIPRQTLFFSFLQKQMGVIGENLSVDITTDVVLCCSTHVTELTRQRKRTERTIVW